MTELKPCPFCGYGKPQIDRKRRRAGYTGLDDIVYRDTYSVRCHRCHSRGGTASGLTLLSGCRVPEPPEWLTTADELKAKAIEAWNRRAENDDR